ncbi:MAG: chromosomal replication initiator protein DnaA [Candidatus Omnitrophica bacterium]|nr:chromosomal replication initiator protein DnaA [Candidatus Omnitrophota bacterium]MDD5592486.1 chromosomal replication initiator protein DnaA [Candidatus Omnitrophota bacterium]
MLDVQGLWEKAKSHLQDKLGKTTFDTWILPLKPKYTSETELTLAAPDTFFRDWVNTHYGQPIQEAINGFAKQVIRLHLEAASAAKDSLSRLPPLATTKIQDIKDISGLNSRYTFENFVIGPSNRHAHAYSLAVAESPAKTYNPLFIYGGVGLGKTHLIQAVCHHAKNKAGGNLKICYMTSERFTNELIDAIQHHSTPAFRQKYRNVDILVIDDIHFIAGKESTQEEFFHTFNTLYDAHKQIIISSDRPPKEISNLQDRLVSRFGWGLTTDIQPPDLETRVAILKKKIEREPVAVPDEVIFFIAQLIKTNIRELEGALIRTIAYSLLEEKPITLELTKEVLKDLLKEPQKLITVDFIQRCVAEEYGVSLADLKTRRRSKNIVLPRQVAMYLSRELTDLSLPEIGNFFGGKDHTTVLHSYNKIKNDLNSNEILKNKVERVIQVIQQ